MGIMPKSGDVQEVYRGGGRQRDASRTPGQGRNKIHKSVDTRNLEDTAELVQGRKEGTSSLWGNPITGTHIGSSPFQAPEIPQGGLSRRHKLGLP